MGDTTEAYFFNRYPLYSPTLPRLSVTLAICTEAASNIKFGEISTPPCDNLPMRLQVNSIATPASTRFAGCWLACDVVLVVHMMSGTSEGNWSSQKFQWRLLTSFEPERLPNPVVKELIAARRCGYTSQELPILLFSTWSSRTDNPNGSWGFRSPTRKGYEYKQT